MWVRRSAIRPVPSYARVSSRAIEAVRDACKRRGSDFFHNIDRMSEANEYAKAHGVPLMIGEPGQASVAEIETEGEGKEGET